MSEKIYLVTGANRGVGLGFVKHLSIRPQTIVIASARDPTEAIELNEWAKSHNNVHIVKYDASLKEDAPGLVKQIEKISDDGIDTVIANAAFGDPHWTILQTPDDNWEKHYRINSLGPILLFKALYPLLLKRSTREFIAISSHAGQISDTQPRTFSAYGQSKAALNYALRQLSFELHSENFKIVPLHPGGVLTDLLKASMKRVGTFDPERANRVLTNALTVDQSVSGLLKVIDHLTQNDNGKFFNWAGESMIW